MKALDETDLLQLSPAAGCGCKVPLDRMEGLLTFLEQNQTLDVGHNKSLADIARDDATVYPISAGQLLVSSLDFGTPISNNARTWGKIATFNALSDLYAMGARPLFVLSILGWPPALSQVALQELMSGALTALAEEQTPLLGGHTISSSVPLFGLSVSGIAQRDRVMTISDAQPGQHLVLTKPIGTGIVVLAIKARVASEAAAKEAELVMASSNRVAADIAVRVGIRAATDVTGYGLIGHLYSMLKASNLSARIYHRRVSLVGDVRTIVSNHGLVSHVGERTYYTLEQAVDWGSTPMDVRLVFCDPQTSGGLLLAADPSQLDELLRLCAANRQHAVEIGVLKPGPPRIVVR